MFSVWQIALSCLFKYLSKDYRTKGIPSASYPGRRYVISGKSTKFSLIKRKLLRFRDSLFNLYCLPHTYTKNKYPNDLNSFEIPVNEFRIAWIVIFMLVPKLFTILSCSYCTCFSCKWFISLNRFDLRENFHRFKYSHAYCLIFHVDEFALFLFKYSFENKKVQRLPFAFRSHWLLLLQCNVLGFLFSSEKWGARGS